MSASSKLKGWQFIIYQLIKNNFQNKPFVLKDIYKFEKNLKDFYPENNRIKEKIRQQLQILRKKNLLEFIDNKGAYKLFITKNIEIIKTKESFVYLLSNPSIPEWIKIGKANVLSERLRELYNTSVPLPFVVESTLKISSGQQAYELENTIHTLIDEINPNLRKNTNANKREFFNLSVEKGKKLFLLVAKINKCSFTTN